MLRNPDKRLFLGKGLSQVLSGVSSGGSAPPSLSYAQQVLADSPLVYCDMLDASGANCTNLGSVVVTPTCQGAFTRGITYGTMLGGGLSTGANGDYVQIADSLPLRLTGDMTLEIWVLTARYPFDSNGFGLFCKGDDGVHGKGYEFRIMQNGTLEIGNETFGTAAIISSGKVPMDGKFHHLVATRSGNVYTLYIDGAFAGTGTSAGAIVATTRAWDIGRASDFGSTFPGVSGAIAQFAIYNTALSAARISAHYNALAPYIPSLGTFSGYDKVIAADNPLLWLPLHEPSGNFVNRGWWGGSATPNGTITRSVGSGIAIGDGVTFGGTLADFISFPGDALDPGLEFSIECWVKAGVLAANGTLLGKGRDAAGHQSNFALQMNTTRVVQINTIGLVSAGTIPNDSAFHHVVFTRSGQKGMDAFYIDGLMDTVSSNVTQAAQSSSLFYLGVGFDGLAAGRQVPFTGSLAQCAFYPYALPPARVAAHYDAGIVV